MSVSSAPPDRVPPFFPPALFSTNLQKRDPGNQVGLSISGGKTGKKPKACPQTPKMIVGLLPQGSLRVFESLRACSIRGQHCFRLPRSNRSDPRAVGPHNFTGPQSIDRSPQSSRSGLRRRRRVSCGQEPSPKRAFI